ncbi:MAG: ATP-binding protein [Planctomycetes bacterium]|nr:ATP-binding protein [Planctomycetota bacterium]
MKISRYLESPILADLPEKMVFVAGPRQVGKTTLATAILASAGVGLYLSWDRREDRRVIQQAEWPAGEALVVLDELHKFRTWKRFLKGEYDTNHDRVRFLVTGSARLDVYRRGGDSLQGRYHHYRLHPLTAAEADGEIDRAMPSPGEPLAIPARASPRTTEQLMKFGGFPEPFLAASERGLRRWQKERLDRFFREDVRDLTLVRDLASLELLADLLTERVASPLSLNALREDLEVSHRAVASWIEILERLYFVFRIHPFLGTRLRGLKKATKLYLWEMSPLRDRGARFENLVALHLLKFCHYLADVDGYRMDLHYLRDRAGREVDFLVVADRKPWFAVEAKLGEEKIDPALRYYRERLGIPWAYQVVLDGQRDFERDGIRCLPAHRFFAALR